MNTFATAVSKQNKNQKTTTENGMKSRVSTGNFHLDLFNSIGASRGQDILPKFIPAFSDNFEHTLNDKTYDSTELAIRILLWSRDIRGGAGERQIFKDVLTHLEKYQPEIAMQVIKALPEVGRWDDILLNYSNTDVQAYTAKFIQEGLLNPKCSGLCAKWMPRQGKWAALVRKEFEMTAKQYRKFLVDLSNTVEQKMSAKDWESIVYSHVPSKAASKYRKAFKRNDETRYNEYLTKLQKGDEKVNAGALFPYDITNQLGYSDNNDARLLNAQWEALPNYMNGKNILPMVDVSGSMMSPAISSTLNPMKIAISLGLYCADKNTGAYKDLILTFTSEPFLYKVAGNSIFEKYHNLRQNNRLVGYSTNIGKAFKAVLDLAIKNKIPELDMPEYILIMSDMQFNNPDVGGDLTFMKFLKKEYKEAGYKIPKIVFWNLADRSGNIHVKSDKEDVALVSGFSPAILKSVLGNIESFTPMNVMFDAILGSRYEY